MGRSMFLNSFKRCSRRATVYVQAPPPWNVPPCSTPCHRLGRLTFVISNTAGQTKQCIDCRNQRVSHHSRSKVVLQTLRNIALRPSSPGRPATKRTDGDAGLSPPNERSGTQPTSPEKLRQLHTARSLFGEPISQPQVVLGTPIPPTQQSLRNFRTLAPSPTVQPTTNQIAFHKGGKDSQNDASKAEAKARQVAIQRDHRSRRLTDEPGGADRLGRPVVQIKVNNVGPGAAAAPDDKAGKARTHYTANPRGPHISGPSLLHPLVGAQIT
ncbi:hypothetical protein Forpi1262_v018498 [Fusarium oxysporum f. sp. raphani]|uniref:Uncharacterized protein n=1 Tax=Fusarium oxysporum f. sp. raphani TaxID=96318 RepID=A0A8J5NJY4_FUSOX|nr:hypothetical protein Forpi1262_v018498 [Fusarium oxysporum f. sp. raphani]